MKKPEYRVPLMSEIDAISWNGFNAISTFSGCGGSSLGYKMAGFKVLWASEFIPAAQETYRANHKGAILDTRDIRQVKPDEVLSAIGKKQGELDLMDGSPPCASFSTAGKREAGWGKVKKYSDTNQRTDDLFFEFARLLSGIKPKVFVAENVAGLVKGTAKGYFLEILAALKGCGYRVKCKVLDAQWLGVPQARQRTMFVGVREDLNIEPQHPSPLQYQYTLDDAISSLVNTEKNAEPESDISRYCTGREMAEKYDAPGIVKCVDAYQVAYEPFDVAVCFLVLMFMPVGQRRSFIESLRRSLKKGGAIIVFDKVMPSCGYFGTVMRRLTMSWKLNNGASPRDIISKELSLSGVQRPINPAILGEDAKQFFAFGEFAGYIMENPE